MSGEMLSSASPRNGVSSPFWGAGQRTSSFFLNAPPLSARDMCTDSRFKHRYGKSDLFEDRGRRHYCQDGTLSLCASPRESCSPRLKRMLSAAQELHSFGIVNGTASNSRGASRSPSPSKLAESLFSATDSWSPMRRVRSNSANRFSCGAEPSAPVPEVNGNTLQAQHRGDGSSSLIAGRDCKRSGVTWEASGLPRGCSDTSCALDVSARQLNGSGTACPTRCVKPKPPLAPPTVRRFHSCGSLDQERPTESASAECSREFAAKPGIRWQSPRDESEDARASFRKAAPEMRIQVPQAPSISPKPSLSVVATNLVAQRMLSSQQVDELRGLSQERSGRQASPRTFVQQASARASAASLATTISFTPAMPAKQSLSRLLAKRAARGGARSYQDPTESSRSQAKTASVQQDQAALHATLAHFGIGDGACARSVSPPPALTRLLARSQAVFGGA